LKEIGFPIRGGRDAIELRIPWADTTNNNIHILTSIRKSVSKGGGGLEEHTRGEEKTVAVNKNKKRKPGKGTLKWIEVLPISEKKNETSSSGWEDTQKTGVVHNNQQKFKTAFSYTQEGLWAAVGRYSRDTHKKKKETAK